MDWKGDLAGAGPIRWRRVHEEVPRDGMLVWGDRGEEEHCPEEYHGDMEAGDFLHIETGRPCKGMRQEYRMGVWMEDVDDGDSMVSPE
mmetsp:Transcript_8326/g.17444  ORF Transcript_8326/g.17444 Transcript_8326/m.17444 type:complete len:88 (+) Transcript_8326:1672-1935(+)